MTEQLYILRDGFYYVENVNRGQNGKPIWCHHPLNAARMDAAEAAEWSRKLIAGGWLIDIDPVVHGTEVKR